MLYAMLTISDLKPGVFFEINKTAYQVISSEHFKMGRGGAILRTKCKNLLTGAIIDRTFKGGEQFKEANVAMQKGQFLYFDQNIASFMESATYNQHELEIDKLAHEKAFLKEGLEIDLVLFNNKVIGINLPPKVELEVTYAEPGLRGDTQGSATKLVTLETGYKLQVPLFIKTGDKVIVDTRDGNYEARA